MAGKYIAYLRVSTEGQLRTGLGLGDQQERIARYVEQQNGNGEVLASYTEVESGKRDDRPELERALTHAELTGATLVVATLDRLTRDERFLQTIRDRGVKFRAVDMPEANEIIVDIMARLARYEREIIAERTRRALQIAKQQGKTLGNPMGIKAFRGREDHRKGLAIARDTIVGQADAWAEKIKPVLSELVGQGMSNRAIARELDARGYLTRRGGQWSGVTVRRLRERLGLNTEGEAQGRHQAKRQAKRNNRRNIKGKRQGKSKA